MDADSLLAYLADELDLDIDGIAPDTLLFSTGMIDSFALVSMMVFLEKAASISIAPTDVRLDNFDSIERILAFVDQAKVPG